VFRLGDDRPKALLGLYRGRLQTLWTATENWVSPSIPPDCFPQTHLGFLAFRFVTLTQDPLASFLRSAGAHLPGARGEAFTSCTNLVEPDPMVCRLTESRKTGSRGPTRATGQCRPPGLGRRNVQGELGLRSLRVCRASCSWDVWVRRTYRPWRRTLVVDAGEHTRQRPIAHLGARFPRRGVDLSYIPVSRYLDKA
jgi:hypothetical protein